MIYIDDDLPNHPKVFRAGLTLGPGGPAFVLALHLAGIAHAKKYLTDGFVPDEFLTGTRLVPDANAVARAMAARRVRMWIRVRNGYQIKDWLDWNKSAKEIKEIREKERQRKAALRRRVPQGVPAGHQPASARVSQGVSGVPQPQPQPVPRTTGQQASTPYPSTSNVPVQEPAAAECAHEEPPEPGVLSWRHVRSHGTDADGQPKLSTLTAIARDVIERHVDLDDLELRERIKTFCARDANLKYTSASVSLAVDRARQQLERRRARA